MEEHGLRRGCDYSCPNVVRCRPPDNRKPMEIEIRHCLMNLAGTLAKAQPKAVLTVGETATRVIAGIRGLADNIRWLAEHRPPVIKHARPERALLYPIPHTSPLAWNRNAPDGQKWAEVGKEQVQRMLRAL